MFLAASCFLVFGLADGPEDRALAFLAREARRWAVENRCYSCHNNGDAARALLRGRQHGSALEDTLRWLERPDWWDHNGGEGPFSDKGLARIQFAAALADAAELGLVRGRGALLRAARDLAADQRPDGAWRLDGPDALGSPVTYGTCLATALARSVLLRADRQRYQEPIDRAEQWLRAYDVRSVLDAAAVLIGLEDAADPKAARQKERCLDLIRRGQAADGGWGPHVNSPPEVFDTSLVLLALARQQPPPAGMPDRIARGRAYLIERQTPDGGWPETTRPPGGESYAQRTSTTGWATLALLATGKPQAEDRRPLPNLHSAKERDPARRE